MYEIWRSSGNLKFQSYVIIVLAYKGGRANCQAKGGVPYLVAQGKCLFAITNALLPSADIIQTSSL